MLDCYYMDLSGDCSYEQSLVLSEYLLPERKERVDRLKNKTVAVRQILSGIFLQYCLGKKLDILPQNTTKELKLLYNEHGKPYLRNNKYYFNLSHSGGYVVLALSDTEVGIDIERLREKRTNVAKRFFCKEEYENILSSDKKFLEYWTMKEAFVKCCGSGLDIPLNSFRIVSNSENTYNAEFADCSEYSSFEKYILRVFELKKDYNISVCSLDKAILLSMNSLWNDNLNVKNINLYDIFEAFD